jgi:uncharacterized delta-60 repeat protein
MKKTQIILALMALAACTTNPVTLNKPENVNQPGKDASNAQVLGVIEVEISSEQAGAASAKFIPVGAQILRATGTAVPIASTSFVFTPGATTLFTHSTNKYWRNTFTITNKTGVNFQNLVMYAMNTPANIGGTTISQIRYLDNSSPTTDDAKTIARAVMPTHGMSLGIDPNVDPDLSDLVLLRSSEAAAIQSQLVAPNFTISSPTVLEYGFVAKNLSGGRDIANNSQGTVTWAFKFPNSLPNWSNLGKFGMRYLVVNEATVPVTQSLEEQTLNTAAGNAAFALENGTVRALKGTKYHLNDLQLLSQVKTATNTASLPAAYMPIPAQATTSGQLDNYFGANGWRWLRTNTDLDSSSKTVITAQADGKVVIAAQSTGGLISVMRLNADGELDPSFGASGIVSFTIPSYVGIGEYERLRDFFLWDMAVQPDGKIVLAGQVSNIDISFVEQICIRCFGVIRLTSLGAFDPSFSYNGTAFYSENGYGVGGPLHLSARAVAVKGVGVNTKIIVAGNFELQGFSVIQINDNGTLDTNFANTGIKVLGLSGSVRDVAIDSNGSIVIVGTSGGKFALARVTPTGALDTTFNSTGILQPTIAGINNSGILYTTTILSDNSILVGGNTEGTATGYIDYFVGKFTNLGALDSNFGGGDGYVFGEFASIGNSVDRIYGLTVLSDGSIIGAGLHQPDPNSNANIDTALVKFTSAGVLDTNFGVNGSIRQNLAFSESANEVDSASQIVTSNFKVVTVGIANLRQPQSPNVNKWRIAVARFNP